MSEIGRWLIAKKEVTVTKIKDKNGAAEISEKRLIGAFL